MLLIGILIIILIIGLIPEKISNIFLNRIGTLMFLFSAILSYKNCLYNLVDISINYYGGLWQKKTIYIAIVSFIYMMVNYTLFYSFSLDTLESVYLLLPLMINKVSLGPMGHSKNSQLFKYGSGIVVFLKNGFVIAAVLFIILNFIEVCLCYRT